MRPVRVRRTRHAGSVPPVTMRTILAAVLLALLVPATAGAATFTVTSQADQPDQNTADDACAAAGGACTLRAAVQQANASLGADRITLPQGTYTLGSALPAVTTTIDIDGAGARTTVIDGVAGARVADVTGGGSMTWSGITLTGGGAGLSIQGADLTLDGVAVRDNTLTTGGTGEGGGIYLFTGSLTLRRSTVSGNVVTSTGGNALGGGVAVAGGTTFVAERSTISGNRAAGMTASFGGGLSIRDNATVTLRHVTLAGNAVGTTPVGANLYRQSATKPVTLEDSVIADPSGAQSCAFGAMAPLTAVGRSLDTGTSCGLPAGQLSSTPAGLGPLTAAGGQTDVQVPLAGSALRDAAVGCGPAGGDQRGAPTPSGGGCDIGAAEVSADLTVTLTASRPSVAAGGDLTLLARVKNLGPDAAEGTVLSMTTGGAELVLADVSQGACSGTVCDLGTLASGQTAVATVVVRAPASGPLVASAGATAAGTPDPVADNSTASVTTAVVAPATGGGGTGGGGTGGGGATDTTAPVLGALKAAGSIRRGRAATIRTTLSEPARVTIRVERLTAGRRSGGRCRAGARSGSRCTVATLVGTVRATVTAAGPATLRLPATLRGRRLATGRHRLTVVATDAAGNRSAARALTVVVRA